MSEDMSDVIKNLTQMLNNKEIPDNVQDILKNFSNNTDESTSSSDDSFNSKNSNDSSNSNDESNFNFDFDINTILKMKNVMDSMNNSKDDPRANLLLSLKPYLKESRKSKVDQYIKLFSMGKIFEVFNPLGGDSKK